MKTCLELGPEQLKELEVVLQTALTRTKACHERWVGLGLEPMSCTVLRAETIKLVLCQIEHQPEEEGRGI